jgi:hypothetical protein
VTAIGTRRPREGRCERCDRPLTDLVWGVDFGNHHDWYEDEPTATTCIGEDVLCRGPSVDWRARALAAEARLSVSATSAAIDAFRAKRDATHVCEHGSLARKCGDCDGVESGLEAEAWQARALAAEAALADAEARGRAHGLLAAALVADTEYARAIVRRDLEEVGSPDRSWWDASALGANVVRSAIVFLGHDGAEASRDE